MVHRLVHPPLPVCRYSGKKGGVAPVLPFSAGSLRAGRAITDKPRCGKQIGTMALVHRITESWYTPPLVCVPGWIGTSIVHEAQQKQSCMAPLMGTPFVRFIGRIWHPRA